MSSFIQKKLTFSESLPEIIKKERLTTGLSLEQLSLKTQITLKYLEILEKGYYHLLPGEIYLQQFIKKLAKIFHLNEKSLFSLYQKERKSQLPLLKVKKMAAAPKISLAWLSPKAVSRFLIATAVMAFLGYFAWEIINIFTPPLLVIEAPLGQTITTQSSVEIKGQTEPEAAVLINQQEILAGPSGQFSQIVDLTIGLNVFKIQASKKHSRARNATLSILRQPLTGEVNQATQPISFK